MVGRIHSKESFGSVDGPGIRYVVFTQGCPLRCKYCHNPDTWSVNGGNEMSTEQIIADFMRNKSFYKNGGITVTGGEPLLQIDFVIDLFSKAKKEGIHTCLDTSGIMFDKQNTEKYDKLVAVTDLVMLDIKHIDNDAHKELTGMGNEKVLDFARYLSDKGVELWIRYVVVEGITDDEEALGRLGEFLAELKTLKALDVLPYHTMGVVKYDELGIDYPLKGLQPLSKDAAKRARNVILRAYKQAKKNNS